MELKKMEVSFVSKAERTASELEIEEWDALMRKKRMNKKGHICIFWLLHSSSKIKNKYICKMLGEDWGGMLPGH